MMDNNELMVQETVEKVEGPVVETAKQFDGESFAMGAAGGAAAATGMYLLVTKVFIPLGKKLVTKFKDKKAAKAKEAEKANSNPGNGDSKNVDKPKEENVDAKEES